jgi:hypothetical protein
MRAFSLLAASLLFVGPAFADDDEAKPARDWSTFDPAAAVAAASQPAEPMHFARLWTSKQKVQLFHGLAISANGKRVLAANNRGQCQVYDGATGEVLATLEENKSPVVRAALSPDGAYAAAALGSGEVVTFEASTGKVLQRYPKDETRKEAMHAKIVGLQFAADNRHVAWIDSFAGLYRADAVDNEREGHVFEMRFKPLELDRAAFSSDARHVVCGQFLNANHEFLRVKPKDTDEPEVMNVQATPQLKGLNYAQSEHYFAYNSPLGNLVVQHQPLLVKPGEKNRWFGAPSRLTASQSDRLPLSFSSDEQWLIAVGRGQVELRRVDAFTVSSLHDADFTTAAQVAIAAEALQIAIVDEAGRLCVLALPRIPQPPLAEFRRTIQDLVHDQQFEHLEKIAELLQDDPTSFPGTTVGPKCHFLISNMLRVREISQADDSSSVTPELIQKWLAERPDAKLGRLLEVERLISEAWAARGDGLAISVTPMGWKVFGEKIQAAHEVMEPLLAAERPPPEAFMDLFDIAKAESWEEEECMEQAQRVQKLSPKYIWPHVCLMQKFLVRWGGATPHSSSLYASWAADRIGGAEGNALYVQLVTRLGEYEMPEVLRDQLGIDYDRVWKGCAALQDDPEQRPFGLIAELHMAAVVEDTPRAARVAKIIEREKTPFVSGAISTRGYFQDTYRKYVNQAVPNPESR